MWELAVAAAILAVAQHGPARWALGAAALGAACLTAIRWRHRWVYEWLLISWGYRLQQRSAATVRSAAAEQKPAHVSLLAPVDVIPVRLRVGGQAGVVHDGTGFAVVIGIVPLPGAPPVTELPLATVMALLDTEEAMVSAVQVIMHAELAPGIAGQGAVLAATAYHDLGYRQMPRSECAWLVLRHDPAVSRFAAGVAGPTRDLHNSLIRALTSAGTRAVSILEGLPLRCHLLDAEAARGLLTGTLATAEAAPARRWNSWHDRTRRHVTFWVRSWPEHGWAALQAALTGAPVLSITTSVVAEVVRGGHVGLSAKLRVTVQSGTSAFATVRAVRAAAASRGGRLSSLDGEHAAGVLATLPLGQTHPRRWCAWPARRVRAGSPRAVLPVSSGGVVLGDEGGAGRGPVAVPFFRADGPTAVTVVGDRVLPRLLALRALGSGARVLVVTTQFGAWLQLHHHTGQTGRLMVARPGTQPPTDATMADPWMIIDDTGAQAVAGGHAWQALVSVRSAAEPVQVPPGLDAVLVQHTSSSNADAIAAALSLAPAAVEALRAVPEGIVAVARPAATVQYARLKAGPVERTILTRSLQVG